jgi:hypothetical protein
LRNGEEAPPGLAEKPASRRDVGRKRKKGRIKTIKTTGGEEKEEDLLHVHIANLATVSERR